MIKTNSKIIVDKFNQIYEESRQNYSYIFVENV